MTRRARSALAALFASGLLMATAATAANAQAAGTALHVVPSPAASSGDLVSAAAVSPTDAWAVGYDNVGTTTFRGAPLAEHFDGTGWSIIPTAAVPAGDDVRLAGAGFSSAADGWAVGTDSNLATGNGTSMIERFNGTSWTRLPSPAGEPFRAALRSVAAISPTDAWAVGSGGNVALIEHWDGSAWSIVPGAVSSARLYGITALSASNIWVVGETGTRAVTPVIEHFDGTAWHQVAQPVFTYDSFLISVSADGPNDIWAVGGQSGGTPPVLLEHYNGTAWAEVPNPALPANLTYNGWLRGVTALGPGDVWAVGAAVASSSTSQTLALHFDGTSWQVIPSDNPPQDPSGLLESVAGTAPGQPLWVTGPGPAIETTTG